jgi:hypothetical protein
MKWFRIALEMIGAASLLAVMGFGSWHLYSDSSEKVNKATRKDAMFILNWGGLSPDQDYRITSSYESSRSFTGDYLDYYCIELPKFEVAEWAKDQWHEGPETDSLLANALELALNDARQHDGCIPSVQEANSTGIKIMFRQVVLHDRQPTAADIILYDSQKQKLYYVSFKT